LKDEAMAPIEFRELTLTLPHIALAAVETGAGPLALFCHGITAGARVFEPLMGALGTRFRAVAIDQRGHGRSGKPAGGYSGEDYADDIALAIRHLKAGPALVVGHSLGARNALVAGVKYAGLVRAVVAIDFTPFIETEVFDALDARVAGGDRGFADRAAVKAYLAERYVRLPEDAIERRADHCYAAAPQGLRPLADAGAVMATARGLREDLVPILEQIAVPTLLIRGADSKLVSPEAWARTKALRPDLRAIELEGADHYVPEEIPGAVATVVEAFWQDIQPK
jgi:2-(acetamidomethylene)succinate hydrolase